MHGQGTLVDNVPLRRGLLVCFGEGCAWELCAFVRDDDSVVDCAVFEATRSSIRRRIPVKGRDAVGRMRKLPL
jgi:hypothetical protein